MRSRTRFFQLNPVLVLGTRTVVFALLSYTTAFIIELRKRVVSNTVLVFQTIGVGLDVLATTMMIIGSPNTPFTIHGIFGYSALVLMLVKTSLLWRFRVKNGAEARVTKGLHLYSGIAYGWWVVAFILGALLVFLKKP